MLNSIHLTNFQSHKDTQLDLSSGINIIVGQSDSGKSAIIRALKWLATNRPSGEAFRSNWGGDTHVKIIADGMAVGRWRSKKLNCYRLEKPTQEFLALGSGVPDQVSEIVNMGELNWQGQMDAPFLLSLSSGEVARTLNEVADLDEIDTALANINRMARDNTQSIEATTRGIAAGESELAAFAGVDALVELIEQLKGLQEKEAEYVTEIDRRQKLGGGLVENQKALTPLLVLDNVTERLAALEATASKLEDLAAKREDARRMLINLEDREQAQARLPQARFFFQLERLEAAEEELAIMGTQKEIIVKLSTNMAWHKQRAEEIAEEEKTVAAELNKAMRGTCPLCGRDK